MRPCLGHERRRLPDRRRDRRALRTVTAAVPVLVAVACVGGTSGGSAAGPAATPAPAAPAGRGPPRGAAPPAGHTQPRRRVLPSVVEIKTASGLGSGVVYDTAGHIVTNAHVVMLAVKIVITPSAVTPVVSALDGDAGHKGGHLLLPPIF